MYQFKEVALRRGTNCVKWDFPHVMNPDAKPGTLPMWVADMDFDCMPELVDAIRARLQKSPVLGYSSFYSPRYFRAVCGWYARRFGMYIHSESIVVHRGVVPAIKSLILALTQRGDGILIQMPVYYPFFNTIEATGRKVVNSGLQRDENGVYKIDFTDLAEKLADKTVKMMLLCSPHNPVGRVWRQEELLQLGELCKKNGVILVSDEIHCDIVRSGVRHIPVTTLFPGEEWIITCTAPSKTFNIAGLGLSNTIVPSAEHRALLVERDGTLLMHNPLAIVAVQAAYEMGDAWVDELNAQLDENFYLAKEFFKTHLPLAEFHVPEGSYLGWLDVSAYAADSACLENRLITEAGVMLEAGARFGEGGEGFLRLNLACPPEMLLDGIGRVAGYLTGNSPEGETGK